MTIDHCSGVRVQSVEGLFQAMTEESRQRKDSRAKGARMSTSPVEMKNKVNCGPALTVLSTVPYLRNESQRHLLGAICTGALCFPLTSMAPNSPLPDSASR